MIITRRKSWIYSSESLVFFLSRGLFGTDFLEILVLAHIDHAHAHPKSIQRLTYPSEAGQLEL